MTTGIYPPTGGSAERGGSLVPVEANEQGAVKVDKRLLNLEREIGIKACEFVAAVCQINPFNFVFTEGEMSDLTRRAIVRSVGLTDMSGFPYDELYQERDGRLIRQFMDSYSSDQNFRNGVWFMRSWIVNLKPFIEGKVDCTLYPNNRLTVGGVWIPCSVLDQYLSRHPTGLSLVEYLGSSFHQYNPYRSTPTYADGIGFVVDLFTTDVLANSEQRMVELSTLQHAARILGETDTFITRFGSLPIPGMI